MIIKEIKLKNFLSHKESIIQFKGNVNVIIGHNGAGKSSIIDGIIFGLFRDTIRGIKKQEDILKKGTIAGEDEITLSDNNKTFIIKRNLAAGRTIDDNMTMIDENGKKILLSRGASATTEKIIEILGLDETTLESTVIIGQGRIEQVFEDLPDTIKKILRIDKIEELRESKGVLKEFETRIEGEIKLLDRIEDERKKTENEKKKKEDEISVLKERINILMKQKSDLEIRMNELNEKVINEEKKEKKYIQLKSDIERLQNEISKKSAEITEEYNIRRQKLSLEEQINSLDQLRKNKEELINLKMKIELKKNKEKILTTNMRTLEELKEKLKKKNENENGYNEYLQTVDILNNLKEKENEYNRITMQMENIKEQLEKLTSRISNYNVKEDDLSKLDESIEELNRKYEEDQSKKNELNKQYGELQGRLNELNRILLNLDEVRGSNCPVCGRELSESHKKQIKDEIKDQIAEINREKNLLSTSIDTISEEINNLNKELDRKRKEKDLLNKTISEYLSIKKQIDEMNEKFTQLEEKKRSLTKDHKLYEELNNKVEQLKINYNEYLKYSDVDEEKIKTLENESEELKKEINELTVNINEDVYLDIDKTIKDINGKLKELENIQTLLKTLENKLVLIEDKKKQLEKDTQELEKLNNEFVLLNFNEEEFNKLIQEKENTEKKINQITVEEGQIRGKIEILENDIKSLEQKLAGYDEELKKKQTLREAYNKVKKLRESFSEKNLQAYLMSTVKKIIENKLSEILTKFDLSFTMVELNFNEKNGIYAYTQTGQKLHVNMLSGGERVSLAIALRLAIAKSLMNDIGFMIMDEPTVNLDDYRKRELIDIIKSTTEVVPQIIVVTHDEELLQAGDYVIRLEKRGDSSKAMEENNDITNS